MGRGRERGVVLVLYVLAALTIFGMAGMALDLGQVYLTKTRLQNALDAAALDGAKNLNSGVSVSGSSAKATSTFKTNFSDTLRSTGTLKVETSKTCNCDGTTAFVDGTTPATFLKVTVANVPVSTYLVQIFTGSNSFLVGGSAIAGPEPVGQICGAIPVAVCAKSLTDTDCNDADGCYGYTPGTEFTTQDKAALGSGNWGLVELQCDEFGNCNSNPSSSGAAIRTGMAGGTSICFKIGGTLPTKPGATTGPVDQGIATRFNDYSGGLSATDYPGDTVTTPKTTSTSYATYSSQAEDNPGGVKGRRITAAPIVDCSSGGTGTTTASVLGSMCMFLTKESSGGDISAEVITNCVVSNGTPGTPGSGGPVKIVLYQSSTSS